VRNGLQGERVLIFAELPELRDIETTRFSSQQQQALIEHIIRVQAIVRDEPIPSGADWEGKWELTALVAKLYPDAKRGLIAAGRKAEDVEGLPMVQVVMMHVLHQYQQLQDDLFKWVDMPYWQALPELAKTEQRIAAARSQLEAEPLLAFLPAVKQVYSATSRLERRLAALRCVEAVRLYAAAHDGKLPAALHDITDVPIPIDPMTGKSFEYKADGNKARLSAVAPSGMESLPQNALAYELVLER
jgi:hypothetical protein